MILVGILDTKGLEHSPSLEFLLPEEERKKLEKEKWGKARSLSFFSRLLLMKMYEEKFRKKIPDICYSDEGKPYFRDNVCSFSVSHDENIVVIVLSDEGDIGVDIQSFDGSDEAIKRIENRFLKDVDAKEENCTGSNIEFAYFDLILEGDDINLNKVDEKEFALDIKENKNKNFLLRWTKLESLIKLFGCGFKELKNVNEYLQKTIFNTSFFQHGGVCFALSVAFYK